MLHSLKSIFRKDITHLYVASAAQLSILDTNDRYRAKLLSSTEVKEFSANPVNDIPIATANTVDNINVFCCAVFFESTLAGYCFLAKAKIPAAYNSGGTGLGGIGLDMPDGVLYMYKVFVIPEHRGNYLITLATQLASAELLPDGGWVVASTDVSNHAAQGLFRKLGFVRTVQLSEYRLFGVGFYMMPNEFELPLLEYKDTKSVGLFSGPRIA